jgi:hypothetical protein
MYAIDLAKQLKSRNNTDKIGIIVGTVVSESPLTISILGGDVLVSGNNLYVCRNATTYTMAVSPSGTATHEGLKANDQVALMATEDNQKFFVIDKLV